MMNVLLVVLGGVRADHLSCSGHVRETTPFLDQVAREGVRFSQMIATAAVTASSHATLLTGLYGVTHGTTEENRVLSARHKVLPEYLKAVGYRTAAFSTTPSISPEVFGRGYDAFFTQRLHERLAVRALHYGRKASDRLLRRNDAGARRSNLALKRWLASDTQPFFALVHYNETRLPLHPPVPYDRMFLPPGVSGHARALNQDSNKYIAGQVDMSDEDFAALGVLYDGGLCYVDSRLREIADFLRARGEWEQTLLVVTGDHGQNLGEHGLMGHTLSLYDTVLRVPLLLRGPCVPQGFVVEELAQTTDILPTILRVLDIPEDTGAVQGRPLLEQGRVTRGPEFTVSERFRPNLALMRRRFPDFDTTPLDVRMKAIRTRGEKFVWHSDEDNEFYDLTDDPGETTNLIEREGMRAEVLRRQLFDWLASVDRFECQQRQPELEGRKAGAPATAGEGEPSPAAPVDV